MITDALEMGGIVKGFGSGEACVRALEAGADTLLMPADADAGIRAVVAAVQSGRLTRQRIQESVVKILSAKERLGLDRKRFVDLEGIADVIDSPEANEKAQEMADHAVTLVRNTNNLIPLAAPEHTCFVVMPRESLLVIRHRLYARGPPPFAEAAIASLDAAMQRPQIDEALARLGTCDAYGSQRSLQWLPIAGRWGFRANCRTPSKPSPRRASPSPWSRWATRICCAISQRLAYLATFSTVRRRNRGRARPLGGVPDSGQAPVTIPGMAQYGAGIQTQATRTITAGTAQ